jgi:hypothetical protein
MRYVPVSRTARYLPAESASVLGIHSTGFEIGKNMIFAYGSGVLVRLSTTVPVITPCGRSDGLGIVALAILLGALSDMFVPLFTGSAEVT